jgi:hypothetical protein
MRKDKQMDSLKRTCEDVDMTWVDRLRGMQ